MHILLIIPDYGDGIEVGTEIRRISSKHSTTVLTDEQATYDNILSAASSGSYDIVHFQGHMVSQTESLDRVMLGDGTEIDLSQMASIAHMARAKMFFLNTCLGARFAAYLVKHGIDAAVFSTVEIDPEKAWQVSAMFYEELKRIEDSKKAIRLLDVRYAFEKVSNGQGLYGWTDSGVGVVAVSWPRRYMIAHAIFTSAAIIASIVAILAG